MYLRVPPGRRGLGVFLEIREFWYEVVAIPNPAGEDVLADDDARACLRFERVWDILSSRDRHKVNKGTIGYFEPFEVAFAMPAVVGRIAINSGYVLAKAEMLSGGCPPRSY